MPHTEPSHTISNINFSQFQEQQQDPQLSRIFVRKTKVQGHLRNITQHPKPAQRHQVLSYNRIFGSEKKIEVPQRENFPKEKEGNLGFAEFFEKHRKFAKPYGQNAKYLDLLGQNHILIRRGPFESPVVASQPVKPRIRGSNYRMKRASRKTANVKTEGVCDFSSSSKNFDRTVSTQASIYRGLMSRERSNRSEQILLNNSVNRLLAAESISHDVPSVVRHRTIPH